MVDHGGIVLPSYSREVFFFCFGDLEFIEDISDVLRDLVPGGDCSVRTPRPLPLRFALGQRPAPLRKGGCIVDNIIIVQSTDIRSKIWMLTFTKNFQTMESVLEHSVWLVKILRNTANSFLTEPFEKYIILNLVRLFQIMHVSLPRYIHVAQQILPELQQGFR